jgi:PTH1 family peptidyl-tRNA hydrolase
MNLSGSAVRTLLQKYDAMPAETMVLIDEVDLPWGMIRIRERGKNSSHNGLKSIISALGTDEFIRVRLGVQPKQIWGDRRDYVLSQMSKADRDVALQMAADAVDAVETILTEGVEKAMSKFNRRATDEEENP